MNLTSGGGGGGGDEGGSWQAVFPRFPAASLVYSSPEVSNFAGEADADDDFLD